MAIQYTETLKRARRLATAFEAITGQPSSISRDGGWRVQNNALSNDAAEVVNAQLDAGTRADRITASMVLSLMDGDLR